MVPDRQVTSLFRTQAGVTFTLWGNTGVNGLRPSYSNVSIDGLIIQDSVRTNDLDFIPALSKATRIAEGKNLEIRADFYNLFNHPNFQITGGVNANSSSFGRMTSQTGSGDGVVARLMQFGIAFRF